MKPVIIIVAMSLSSLMILQPYANAVIVRGWTVQQGTWTVRGATLTGSGVSAEIVSDQTFPSDLTVEVKMKTLVAGGSSWYAAWLLSKYLDECNRILFLIHTNGVLEFNPSTNCVADFHFVQTSLSPLDWHTVRIVFLGNNAKVYVDNVLYFDIDEPAIGAFGASRIQLASWGPSQSTFFRLMVS